MNHGHIICVIIVLKQYSDRPMKVDLSLDHMACFKRLLSPLREIHHERVIAVLRVVYYVSYGIDRNRDPTIDPYQREKTFLTYDDFYKWRGLMLYRARADRGVLHILNVDQKNDPD